MTGDAPPPAAPHITAIERADRRGRRIRLILEDGDVFELALEVAERLGLGVGDPVDAALRAHLTDDDLRWRIRDAALGFLSYRPRSRLETQRRLRERGFPSAAVERCLDTLVEQGLLDDKAFAQAFVRDRLRLRPRGPARLRNELRGKGVAPETAADAIMQGFAEEGTTEAALAVEAALKWLRGRGSREREALISPSFSAEREGALRRLLGFLKRRGFGGEAVRKAVEAVDADAAGRGS